MVWETVAHFLPEEWKPYFDHAQFKKGPLYHVKSEHLEIVLMVDEVFPFELYETLLHNLKLQTHVHVNLGIEARHAKTDMVNLDRYVAYFVEKEPRLKDFRFLHPSALVPLPVFYYNRMNVLFLRGHGLPPKSPKDHLQFSTIPRSYTAPFHKFSVLL